MSEAPGTVQTTVTNLSATTLAAEPATPSTVSSTAASVASGVVTGVQAAHPTASKAEIASKAATILGSIAQMAPEIFAISRASAQTQGVVAVGVGIAEAILQAFI